MLCMNEKEGRDMKNTRTLVLSTILVFLIVACSEKKSTEPQQTPSATIADLYGQLQVSGNKIVDKNGAPVALHGMSMYWSQWVEKYYNYDCIKWLRDDWKCTVIRAAMAVGSDGYLTNPQRELVKVRTVVEACIDLGIYVVIDWHDHTAENYTEEAKSFFKLMASDYGDKANIIYEIYNEPLQVSWSTVIKPYAQAVIEEIRSVDPDNIIVVGTPNWSQDVDLAANDPLDYPNIAYTLHFYAGSHTQWLRTKAANAMNKGIALFVTEWGTTPVFADAAIDYQETNNWLYFTDQHQLSWCNWSLVDINENTAALESNANPGGGWSESNLSESGKLVRSHIIARNDSIFQNLQEMN